MSRPRRLPRLAALLVAVAALAGCGYYAKPVRSSAEAERYTPLPAPESFGAPPPEAAPEEDERGA